MLIDIISGNKKQNQSDGFIGWGRRSCMKPPLNDLLLLCIFLFIFLGMVNEIRLMIYEVCLENGGA